MRLTKRSDHRVNIDMRPANLPLNESARLEMLRKAKILDTEPERAFDVITARAAEICNTPIALVSLVDENRQWFKSKVGVTATETSREIAFCSHAILQRDIMVVADALTDDRFADNPLVTGEPHIRFYAGMPLSITDGSRVGTLCVIDREPRHLTDDQIQQLRSLADSATILLEMRTSWVGELFQKAVATITEGVTVADGRNREMPLIYANNAFRLMTGYTEEEIVGQSSCRLLVEDSARIDLLRAVEESLSKKEPYTAELLNTAKFGRRFWNRVCLVPHYNEAGDMIYVVGIHSDITQFKESETARQHFEAMKSTMGTVNDIVFNFMNNLQVLRMDMEEEWKVETKALQEFDSMFAETMNKLNKINALTKFKMKSLGPGITILDTD
jgi:two-component system cell cycle sensor histidine kinase/response regulator CckA